MGNVSVSIVTVCLNVEKSITKTLDSILSLCNYNFEYVIKDGKSIDGTNRIVKSYKNKFEKKGVRFVHIVSKDEGIYNAMNEAVTYCQGEWVIFINAGDYFFNSNVLEDIFKKKFADDVGVIYGHIVYQLAGNYSFINCHEMSTICEKMPFSHQSILTRKKILLEKKFDCQYKIVADYDLILRLYFQKIKFESVNTIISVFIRDGISTTQNDLLEKEYKILKTNYNLNYAKKNIVIIKIKKVVGKKIPILRDLVFCIKQMKHKI